jgi:hypothetical protein
MKTNLPTIGSKYMQNRIEWEEKPYVYESINNMLISHRETERGFLISLKKSSSSERFANAKLSDFGFANGRLFQVLHIVNYHLSLL